MIKINDEMAIIGTTELRTEIPKLAKNLKVKTVIITKRGKPIAVLEDYEKYREKEDLLDELEDLVLGRLAIERWKKSKPGDFITLEEVKKKLNV